MSEKARIDLSVLIPLYNEGENIETLFQRLSAVLEELSLEWEVIFINDGSEDDSSQPLFRIKAGSPRVKIITFKRNFGKSAALDAGFKLAAGEKVVTMDADLQDDPEEIGVLLAKLEEGYDLVSGWRVKRRDRLMKRLTSRVFNRVTAFLTGVRLHDFNCGLKAFRREAVKNLALHGELHRYIPVLIAWKGFRVTEARVRHYPRVHGRSKFGVYRFFAGLMDLVTVMFLTKYVKKPLHLFGGIGLAFFLLGLLINIYLVILSWLGDVIRVRPMLFLAVLLMLIGFQFISTGLLGEMLSMALHREKEDYIIKEIT